MPHNSNVFITTPTNQAWNRSAKMIIITKLNGIYAESFIARNPKPNNKADDDDDDGNGGDGAQRLFNESTFPFQ